MTSCEVRDVDHCVARRDHLRDRHLDVDHHRELQRLVRHLDADHRNLDELHQDHHRDADHLVHRDDLLGLGERLDLDVFPAQVDYLDLGAHLDLDGSLRGSLDAIRAQCVDLAEAELGDRKQTWGQAEAESDDRWGEHREAFLVASLEEFRRGGLVAVLDAVWAAD